MSAIDTAQAIGENFVGAGSPADQIVAALIVGGVIIATSAVGLVGTLLLLPLPIFALVIGVLRLWPPVDNAYPL